MLVTEGCIQTEYVQIIAFTRQLQSGARNVIPLIVHITHIYYYKNI